jgi:hypothetical protein
MERRRQANEGLSPSANQRRPFTRTVCEGSQSGSHSVAIQCLPSRDRTAGHGFAETFVVTMH